MNTVIEVTELRMRYGTTDVLHGVDLHLDRGEVLALLGPNGAGKTTTIEILEGFRTRSAGDVRVLGLLGVSGIFYPVTALPAWLQTIAQVFPAYWLGLGMRSAFLPDALAAAEIGGSWRHAETVGVLGAWAVLGLLIAPVVLRRMARRSSGTTVRAAKPAA